jgi:hypothetical protein
VKKFLGNKKAVLSSAVIILLVLALVFWLLNRDVKYMETSVDSGNGNHYTLQLPEDMLPASLNPNASLEYEDMNKGISVVLIDESKAKIISFGLDYDLETYMKIASRALDSAGTYVNKTITIGNYKGLQTDIKAKVKEKKLVYHLTCIETTKFFYQVLVATTEESEERNKEVMEHILQSFKETDK